MNTEWICQTSEIRRYFSRSTWVPLRASRINTNSYSSSSIGYIEEFFGCGSVAFPKQHRELANHLSWNEIGIGLEICPHVYSDGSYSSIDEYRYNDKDTIGIHLVFEHRQPVIGNCQWILNPDLVVALGLIKEGNNWIRPSEDFVVVARESFNADESFALIEIKREFLMDYLAARCLSLRVSYYRQRIENVAVLEDSPYAGMKDLSEDCFDGRYELRVRELNDIFGGDWSVCRVWRTDVDPEDDAPVMPPHTNDNTAYESSTNHSGSYPGIRIESEFWRDEWIDHQDKSVRVRGDKELNLPSFIVDTDGSRMPSSDLYNEDIGRWLWFHPRIINEILSHRGFSLKWHTRKTGGIRSSSGYETPFGINRSDLVTVYAFDIARLPAWEQFIWGAHNVLPEGKVCDELLSAQVLAMPANTHAEEYLLFNGMRFLEAEFKKKFNVPIFLHDIEKNTYFCQISRFMSTDRASLLRLAKELVRVFSDRLDTRSLKKISHHADKKKLASNKLLQSILAEAVGEKRARDVFSTIVGVYDMRIGDAHPTSSKIDEALQLAGIDTSASYLSQGEQLIHNFSLAIYNIGHLLFGNPSSEKERELV